MFVADSGLKNCGRGGVRYGIRWSLVAGTLAVFTLAFCLLGAGDARAGETELFSLEINIPVPGSANSIHRSTGGQDFKFEFGGTTYEVNYVQFTTGYAKIKLTPDFPPSGERRNKFDLHLGGKKGSGGYTEIKKLNFNDAEYPKPYYPKGVRSWYESFYQSSPNVSYPSAWRGYGTAVIKISGPTTANNTLQLAEYPEGPNNYTGRLEIFDASAGDNGQWKWVCDDGFGEEEARVACRQLGLPTGGAGVWAMPSDWLNPEDSDSIVTVAALSQIPALLDDVDCDGDESKLIGCDHAGRGVSDCTISEAVGVTCPSP